MMLNSSASNTIKLGFAGSLKRIARKPFQNTPLGTIFPAATTNSLAKA
jgi:hypothetical protein